MIIKRSIRNLLTTNTYERPFKPSLGIDLSAMLFELSTMGTDAVVLEQDIISLINRFEPRAVVTNVVSSLNGNDLNVTLHLVVSNDPRPQELSITLERVR